MPAGRPNKPLFELLRDESTGRRTPPIRPSILARPAPEPELKPVPARSALDPDQEPAPDSFAEDGVSPPEPASHRGNFLWFSAENVHISRYTALVALTVVLGVVFVVFVVAYKAGQREANKDLGRQVQPESPPISGIPPSGPRPAEAAPARGPFADPSLKGAAVPKPKTAPEASKPARPSQAFDDPTKPVLTATGAYDADPRAPGLNYLVLATRLTREDARKLVAFLTVNGLETVGVPAKVESEGRQANNPGSYKVVTLAGLTRDQYRSDDPMKAKLKSEGTRLGELWKDQNRTTIIKDTYWEQLIP